MSRPRPPGGGPFVTAALSGWVDALAGPTPTPAGGALALATLAGAAALGAKIARLTGEDPGPFVEGVGRFLEAADEDTHGYGLAARKGGATARAFLEKGVESVDLAQGLLAELTLLRPRTPPAIQADLDAVTGLIRVSAEILRTNLDVNLSTWRDDHPAWTSLSRRIDGSRNRPCALG